MSNLLNFPFSLSLSLPFVVIQLEKGQQQLMSGIENFDTGKLKHTKTEEKNPLPTKEIIEAEKQA